MTENVKEEKYILLAKVTEPSGPSPVVLSNIASCLHSLSLAKVHPL